MHVRMKLGKVVIKSDCGLSLAASKIDRPIISLFVYPISTEQNFVFSITDYNDPALLKLFLKKDFLSLSILKGDRTTFIRGIKKSHGIMRAIILNSGIPTFPIYAKYGTETVEFLSYHKEYVNKIFDEISMHNYVEENYYINYSEKEALTKLTDNFNIISSLELTSIERKILKKAYNAGFFTWPRKYDLKNLSSEFKLSKPTLLFHLRNAERKILKLLFENNNIK